MLLPGDSVIGPVKVVPKLSSIETQRGSVRLSYSYCVYNLKV